MGLDVSLYKTGIETGIKLDSKLHPDHMYKIGYFRSSYNSSGVNAVLRRTIGKDLYYVFYPKDYEVGQDWAVYLRRAIEIQDEFKVYVDKYGDYDVMRVSGTIFKPENAPKDERDALEIFFKERKGHKLGGMFNAYSNGLGSFYVNGIKCYGFMPLPARFEWEKGVTDFVVITENKDNFKWYVEALEIVIETLEYIISQKDSKKYRFSWSA